MSKQGQEDINEERARDKGTFVTDKRAARCCCINRRPDQDHSLLCPARPGQKTSYCTVGHSECVEAGRSDVPEKK
jgi:hypothetical protein